MWDTPELPAGPRRDADAAGVHGPLSAGLVPISGRKHPREGAARSGIAMLQRIRHSAFADDRREVSGESGAAPGRGRIGKGRFTGA